MEFSDYLVGRRLLTREELKRLLQREFYESVSNQTKDLDGFITLRRTTDEPAWTTVRRPPFGEVLARMPDVLASVLKRSAVNSLTELVEKWHRDLIGEMECVGNYAPGIRCAANLFKNRLEKKIVARYVVSKGRIGAPQTLIKSGEKIALLEGSSALFVALAAAHRFTTCSVISSNGLLNSEYLHNPCIAKSFKSFHIVGGETDVRMSNHTPEHAGVYGNDAASQFKKDMRHDPGATTLVVPCSGFLPEVGPMATSGEVQQLKASVIDSALKLDVHQVLFIIDYSKMLSRKADSYGIEVFSATRWRELLRNHGEKFTVVTAPPPTLREALAEEYIHPCNRQKLNMHYAGVTFSEDDYDYNQVAAKFHTTFGTGAQFHEALYIEPDGFVDRTSQTSETQVAQEVALPVT